MNHTLKTWSRYFNATLAGNKNFEIRHNKGRSFQKGDQVTLRELGPEKDHSGSHKYSGRKIRADISFVTNFQQRDNYVVFAMTNIKQIS